MTLPRRRHDRARRVALAAMTLALIAVTTPASAQICERVAAAPLRDVAAGLWRGRLAPPADAPPLAAGEAFPARGGVAIHVPPQAEGRRPTVFFFAGLGGRADAAQGVIDRLVAGGVAVVAVDDRDGAAALSVDLATERRFRRFMAEADAKVAADARAAADALDALVASPWAERLRLDRVGAVGFSFGGAVAAQWATFDSRVVAAVDLDGWLFADAAAGAPGPPLLVMGSDAPVGRGAEAERRAVLDRRDAAATVARPGATTIVLRGAAHADFTDAALERPAWRGWLRADPRDVQRRAARLSLDFLEGAWRGGADAPAPCASMRTPIRPPPAAAPPSSGR